MLRYLPVESDVAKLSAVRIGSTPESVELIDAVRDHRLFGGVDPDKLLRVNADAIVHFTTGQVLLHEGDAPDQVLVLRRGEVEVSYSGVSIVSRRAGDIIGEQAFIEETNRTQGGLRGGRDFGGFSPEALRDLEDAYVHLRAMGRARDDPELQALAVEFARPLNYLTRRSRVRIPSPDASIPEDAVAQSVPTDPDKTTEVESEQPVAPSDVE